jgi:hypothetical protein
MEDKMDDSDLALEQAITKIDSGDDLSSGSDRETEETPAPVVRGVSNGETGVLSGGSFQEEGPERVLEEGGSGGGGGGGAGEQQRAAVDAGQSGLLHVPRSQVTLDMVFRVDYKLFTMFRRFLKDQCILRNLNFWLACKHYHELPQEQLFTVANAIYAKYIKMTAPQLVQIKQSTKRTIKSILGLNPKTLSNSLFKPAQDEVWDIMTHNELRQFLASDVFGEMFGEVEDSMSMELAFTPVGGVLRGASPMIHQSSSEDSVSVTSCSTDGGGSELGRCCGHRLRLPYHRSHRACSSDTETKSFRSHHMAGPLAKKDKPVTREDFVAMVSERLMAVAKDRDTMKKRAQDQARQQGKSYEEIMAIDWYDLPNSIKYDRFLGSAPPPMVSGDLPRGGDLSPPHSPSLGPYANPQSKLAIEQGQLAQHEIQDALKDLEITNQVSRNRRHLGHPKSSSAASSILSYTSDSGVGDSVQWGTTTSSMVASSRHVQRFVEGQNQLLSKTPQRDIAAKAAAITLINSSPHPEDLSYRVHSLSGRHRLPQHQLHTRTTNYPGAYSSDDSGSFITLTSESDLFIPRRFPAANYSESDEPHHFPSRLPHRQLSRPRRTGFKMHQTPPIVEPSHTPTSQSQMPRPAAPPQQAAGILVVYDIVDMPAQDSKRTPFIKKHHSSTVTLGEFKEKIFNRKGEYRFFFKTVYEGIEGPLMEEISDEETVLPQFEGRIIARVESVV